MLFPIAMAAASDLSGSGDQGIPSPFPLHQRLPQGRTSRSVASAPSSPRRSARIPGEPSSLLHAEPIPPAIPCPVLAHGWMRHTPKNLPSSPPASFPRRSPLPTGDRSPLRRDPCCSLSSALRRRRRPPWDAPLSPKHVGRSAIVCGGRSCRQSPSGQLLPRPVERPSKRRRSHGQVGVDQSSRPATPPASDPGARPRLCPLTWSAPAWISGSAPAEAVSLIEDVF